MKRNDKNIFKMFFPLILATVFLPFTAAEGAMNSYCITPPFVSQNISPNVLIILDSSGSMNCLAYQSSYNPSQFVTGYYYGYFDPTKNYRYDISVSPDRWIPTTNAITTGTAANPIASGNFLNWITMSRQDVAKKILVGGRASSGAYAAADRTTNPVKLYGNANPQSGWTCATDDKSHDSTATNLIYPFVGDYKYTVATDGSYQFSIAFNDPSTLKLYPNSNFSSTNPAYTFPAAWVVTGSGPYQAVDETTANTTDYIVNKSSTAAALFGYDQANAALLASSGTISNVRVYAYAKKTGSSTVNLQGVLRLKSSSTDIESASGSSSLSTSFALVSLGVYSINPQTGAAWQWSDLTGTSAVGSLLSFGVKASLSGAGNPTTSNYPTVSQVYIQINVSSPSAGGPYNIIVDQGSTAASGVLDKMTADVRFGLANYNTFSGTSDGGKVLDYIDYGSITGIVSSITTMVGSGGTPLGETLYEMTRYFRQDSTYSGYSSADYMKGCSGATSGTSTCAAASTPNSKDPYFYDFTDATLADKYVPCAKSFVIFMTDGESYGDQDMPGSSTAAPYSACTLTNIKACSGYGGSPNNPDPRFAGTDVGQTYPGSGTDYLIDVAYWARTNDMRPGTETDIPTNWRQSLPGTQNIYLYPVYLFGSGSTLLKDASIYGGFTDLNGNNKPDCTTTPAECYRDSNGDGSIKSDGTDDPVTYYEGDDGYKLEASITSAIEDILKRVTSGTAASVLASGEGSGANLVQAVFYPLRKFSNGTSFDEIAWSGRITNLWYYVDPLFTTSNIREEDGDGILDLNATTGGSTHDFIVSLYFDKTAAKAKAHRWEDPNGNGVIGTQLLPDIEFEALGNLWEAGTMLWKRDVTTAAGKRKIYTTINGTSLLAGNFSRNTTNPSPAAGTADADNSATLVSYLSVTAAADASKLIDWVQGVDVSGYRSRTVKVESIDSTARVWKLGDIVNSTPKISSWTPLNAYGKVYGDLTYSKDSELGDPPDVNHFTTTAEYKGRGMVFTGGNDGMLHAFKLGTLQLKWSSQGITEKARLVNPDTNDVCKAGDTVPCGKEIWAFIPKNVLPYLQYMADPAYCHLYAVDLTPFIFDASIDGLPDDTRTVSSWKTILIGGMRFGGACKASTDTCTNCVKTPIPNVGYSSYFALDITDQNNPKLLWEFSHTELGFASTGPAVVRINGKTAGVADKLKNGNWFVIFGSGPTGPISTSDHQFMGTSDQNLKLFILDLKTGNLLRTLDTVISNAFAGSLVNSTLDTDNNDYQDEIMYVPYIKKCTANTAAPSPFSSYNTCTNNTWTNGGVGRLSTKRDTNPSNWTWSTFIDNIGPVSSAVTKIVDKTNNNLWIYFGTGRYYFTQTAADDESGQRFLFGVKDPCFTSSGYDLACTTAATPAGSPFTGLTDVTNIANVPSTSVGNGATVKGWYLALDPFGTYTYAPDAATSFSSERVITDPLASLGQALVYFTTYKPTNDLCTFGGKSFIWALQYNTGGVPTLLSGKALIQVSTGAIEQKDLSTAFTDAGSGYRKSAAMEGKPPEAQGLSIIAGPPPTKKVIHIKER